MKTNVKDIEVMLKRLCKDGSVEFSDLKSHYKFKDAIKQSKNMYFRAGVSKDKAMSFNKDTDIIEKNYFVIDLDIRENTDGDISNEDIKDFVDPIEDILKEDEYLSEWSYIIYTGNGLHIYYIGDFIEINIKKYSEGVCKVFDDFYKLMSNYTELKPDYAMQNIARYSRLPGTTNFKMLEKYQLEPQEVEIIKSQDKHSRMVGLLNDLGATRLETKNIEISRQKESNESKYFKKKMNGGGVAVYEAICEIPLNDLVCEELGFIQKSNLHYFYGPDKKEPQGVVYHQDNNTIFHGGCSSWAWGEVGKTYNTFGYIRDRENLTDKETFERFKERYDNIKELDSKPKTQELIIPQKEKLTIPEGFVFPNKCFNELGCLQTGELVVIVAEGHSGKTTFALDTIYENSLRGKRGTYINLEFPIKTMRESRWLFINNKKKENINDINPMSDSERNDMRKYVESKLAQFDYTDHPGGVELEELIKMIIKKSNEGYRFIVVDSFSKIDDTRAKSEYSKEKNIMVVLQELVQKLQICIVLLHHTNKIGDFAGTQKIFDDSNVFMTIARAEDEEDFEEYRIFSLNKDKITKRCEVEIHYVNQQYISKEDYTTIKKKNYKDPLEGSY